MLATFGYGTGRIATHGYSPAVEKPAPERIRIIVSLFESKIFSSLPRVIDTVYYSPPVAYDVACDKTKENLPEPLDGSGAANAAERGTITSYNEAPRSIAFERGSVITTTVGRPRGAVQPRYLSSAGVQSAEMERRGPVRPQYLRPSRNLN